ncbi:MAG: cupin domain-containing protein [Betaproteobacteria bacterium]|nr:MAG: cupin domain-containing protein [Betaproteobacteria bacterium]
MRRFVTGHDAQGRSVFVVKDEPQAAVLEKAGGLRLTELWATPNEVRARRIEPDPGGTVFRVIEYPPDRERLKTIEPEAHFASMGAQAARAEKRKHPGMHRTKTLDYAIIVSGEIYAVLDEEEVLLKAGDVLVQRGTNHAWSNRGDAPCLIAFVLIDAA